MREIERSCQRTGIACTRSCARDHIFRPAEWGVEVGSQSARLRLIMHVSSDEWRTRQHRGVAMQLERPVNLTPQYSMLHTAYTWDNPRPACESTVHGSRLLRDVIVCRRLLPTGTNSALVLSDPAMMTRFEGPLRYSIIRSDQVADFHALTRRGRAGSSERRCVQA